MKSYGKSKMVSCRTMCLVFVLLVSAVGWGRLEVCDEHPYYFRDGNRHIVLVGVSDRALFSIWENDKGFSWRKYLTDLAEHHLNYVRQDVTDWNQLTVSVKYPGQFSSPGRPL